MKKKPFIITVKEDDKHVTNLFIEMGREDLKKMKEALEGKNFAKISLMASMINNSIRCLRLKTLAEIGQSVFDAADNKDEGRVGELLEEFSDMLGRVDVRVIPKTEKEN